MILNYIFRFPAKDPVAYHEFTFGKSYTYLCSTLTMRGWDILPIKSSAQVALFSLLVFGTLTYLHWEAMLISYLSTRKIVLPFQNIPELISKTQYRIILSPGSSYEDDFRKLKGISFCMSSSDCCYIRDSWLCKHIPFQPPHNHGCKDSYV